MESVFVASRLGVVLLPWLTTMAAAVAAALLVATALLADPRAAAAAAAGEPAAAACSMAVTPSVLFRGDAFLIDRGTSSPDACCAKCLPPR